MAVYTFTQGEKVTTNLANTYMTNGGLVWISSTTVGSGVTTVTVSNAFSATYDSYRIVVRGITPSAQDSWMLMMGSDGAINREKLEALVLLVNGRYLKGLSALLKARRSNSG